MADIHCGEFPSNGLPAENIIQAQISMVMAFASAIASLNRPSDESWGCATRPVSSSEGMLRMHLKSLDLERNLEPRTNSPCWNPGPVPTEFSQDPGQVPTAIEPQTKPPRISGSRHRANITGLSDG